MREIKETLTLMKKDFAGCCNSALLWISTLAITVLLSSLISLEILPIIYILVVMPSIISIRFIYLSFTTGKKISFRSFRIGYITFQSSIKLYFRMIVDALVAFVALLVASMFIYVVAFRYVEPDSYQLFLETKELSTMYDLLTSPTWYKPFFLISLAVSALIYLLVKFKSNFLPYIAFQAPIDARSAKRMSSLMLKGNYFKYSFMNLTSLLFLIPIGYAGYKSYVYMYDVRIATVFTSLLVAVLVCSLLLIPVVSFYGIYNAVYYNSHSEPFQKEINGALDRLLRELKELEDVPFSDEDDKNK